MPTFSAQNISFHFDNGEALFTQLSCSMTKRRVGLVGRNGIGKSVFTSILSGEIAPSDGTVTKPRSYALYRQQDDELLAQTSSIARYLGKESILDAIKQIEAGSCDEKWFNLVGEQWDLENKLSQQLSELGLPANPYFCCSKLSGGQLARLQLWQLFDSEVELLILDEPSNHLDRQAKQWLIHAMKNFPGSILLVSHDRELLREVDEIWEMSQLGLQTFGGNYDTYEKLKRVELQAVERQLNNVEKIQKQLIEQAQKNKEKAEQRASQSNKARKDGSQPKILLDGMKNSAERRLASRNKNEQLRMNHLQQKGSALRERQEQLKTQKIYLVDGQASSKKVLSLLDVKLKYGCAESLTLQVFANDKLHLKGGNGSGKSTLLKTLQGRWPIESGECQVNTPLYYLDQHFNVIQPQLSMLDNLMSHCNGMKESHARTLLAGIGFRRDSVFRLGSALSGGEKMKLAMLIVSHQPSQPFLLLDEPDNHLDLESKINLASALIHYQGGFILISHDHDFASESGVIREITLS
ncbi:ABC-F family ATP-binding cassette domain-containing protein [Vibrio ouci]|uniref:ABC-F family ATP-binding cassette domain-containing protein n=1 Tax=Vibrio ouci TaxID=2499078 RepID=A0A4Y8WK68_9VIBR|nr:ATP-binding cassette domain-containing protein [Vibrio ouci]TFH93224.1 ABC-F family ATP-binding cassette domain-containing protein [Vibrio ouci]